MSYDFEDEGIKGMRVICRYYPLGNPDRPSTVFIGVYINIPVFWGDEAAVKAAREIGLNGETRWDGITAYSKN